MALTTHMGTHIACTPTHPDHLPVPPEPICQRWMQREPHRAVWHQVPQRNQRERDGLRKVDHCQRGHEGAVEEVSERYG